MKRSIWALVALLGFSCSKIDDVNHVISVTMQNNGTEIGITLADTLHVSLQANYTTPFRWNVSALDMAILKVVDTNYIPDQSANPGSGGTAVFMFAPVAIGRSEIKLVNQNFAAIVSDSFSIVVNVHAMPD